MGRALGARPPNRFFSETPHFRAYGAVTTPTHHQASPRYQFLFVNRRPVQNRRLTRAIYDAYKGQLPSLRHPGWAIFVEVDPSTVDVNVHPSKREVKLTHESQLYGFLNAAVKKALRGVRWFKKNGKRKEFWRERTRHAPIRRRERSANCTSHWIFRDGEAPFATSQFMLEEQPLPELFDLHDPELTVLAQVRRTFIVAQTRSGLIILDQHAAAEKAAYEKLLANLKSAQPPNSNVARSFLWRWRCPWRRY